MSRFARDLPFGATPLPDGRTRFRIWAPEAESVELLIERDGSATSTPTTVRPEPVEGPSFSSLPSGEEGQGLDKLSPNGSGWYEAIVEAGAGTRYRYRIDGLDVPDPASRFQPEDVHGPSLVVDPRAYEWRVPDWQGRPWEEVILYEVHTGVMGGFTGVAERLPALKELGITAIELMPIADFPGTRNWGYDGVLPFAPDAAYGTPEELKSLVDRAHELGLMIFLDVVYNHFGPDGNYLPTYAKSFFTEAKHTPWGAAIDFDKEPVARFFIENALYWLEEYRFDGLRFDAVHAIENEAFLDRLAEEVRAAIPDRRVHLVLENESNDAERLDGGFDAQWNDDFHNVLHVLLTDEKLAYYQDFAERPAERLARCLAEGFIYQGEGSPNHDGKPRGKPSAHLPATRFVSFLQNHDQVGNRALGERLTQLAHPAALRAAMGLLLLSPQIPMLFMGEEEGSTTPFLFFTDFHDELADAVREGRRKEFAKFPAFADPEQREKIPDPNARATLDASRPAPGADAPEWRNLVAELVALRHEQLIPRLHEARSIGAQVTGDKAVLARWRLSDGAELTIALNLGSEPARAALPASVPLHAIGGDGNAPRSFAAWLEPRA